MQIQYLGHSAFRFILNKNALIVDPFISGNPLAKEKITVSDLKADFILLTHAHQDHTLDVEAIASQNNPIIISNFEICTYYEKKGFQGHALNFGGGHAFDFGYIKYIQALHSSSFPDGTYGGNPGGFIIQAEGKTLHIAGDTALTYDMKLLAERYTIDIAILPIGDNFTMDVEDAVKASDFLGCPTIIGCHYDSFPAITIDHQQAIDKFQAIGKELLLFDIGETRDF